MFVSDLFSNTAMDVKAKELKKQMMKFRSIFVLLISCYILFCSSCANQGMPTGGDKDSIPPVVIKTLPAFNSRNFKGNEVRLTFDEYIIPDEVSEKLVVSPPVKKRPLIKMKSKTLIIDFSEGLKQNATYSLDFKNSIVDNNEKNPLENLRLSFSTGDEFDTLKVAGYVKDALSQEPLEGILVVMHKNLMVSAFYDSIPDYISKTNEEGFFLIENIAGGKYYLYALDDLDNSMTYNQATERIAFTDSIIIPSVKSIPKRDTIIRRNDTIVATEEIQYFPQFQYLSLFEENKFNQFLSENSRTKRNKLEFIFTEPLDEAFSIDLIRPEMASKWNFVEFNKGKDSIIVWVLDSLISRHDTMIVDLNYHVLDSMGFLSLKHDTLEMFYQAPKQNNSRRKKKETDEIEQFAISTNIKSSGHDLFRDVVLESPEPLQAFDTSMIHLFTMVDTIEKELPIVVIKDTTSVRRYHFSYNWSENTEYRLELDSAAAKNIYGNPSRQAKQKFRTQKQSYYGNIVLKVSNLPGPCIVQLLEGEKETVLKEILILDDGEINFPFLKPSKYRLRLIHDSNKNGIWDTGYLDKKLQPEKVVYYPKVLSVRSNFEYKESWDVNFRPDYIKNLIDEDQKKDNNRQRASGRSSGRFDTQ